MARRRIACQGDGYAITMEREPGFDLAEGRKGDVGVVAGVMALEAM